MSAATFQGGRGINPIATVPARIHGWTLVFDIGGIPYKDPAFSSIAPISIFPHGLGNSEKQMEVCGVAYLVTLEDYIQIIASEGGGITYREVQLLAEPLYQLTREAGLHLTELPVMTLVTEFGCSPPRCPSLRYKVCCFNHFLCPFKTHPHLYLSIYIFNLEAYFYVSFRKLWSKAPRNFCFQAPTLSI